MGPLNGGSGPVVNDNPRSFFVDNYYPVIYDCMGFQVARTGAAGSSPACVQLTGAVVVGGPLAESGQVGGGAVGDSTVKYVD